MPWLLGDEAALAALSDTVTPQGVVAVCRSLTRPLADLLAAEPTLVVVCADVRDPGNAGTVIRCADAVAADLVVLTGDSVDVHNGKTVRASAGSVFHLPVAVHRDTEEAIALLQQRGLQVLAADAAGEHRPLRRHRDVAGARGLAVRQRGARVAPADRGPGRPPGRDPDPRRGGEPQPRDRRCGLPLRHPRRPALTLALDPGCPQATTRRRRSAAGVARTSLACMRPDDLDLLPDGVIVTDGAGVVTRVNDTAQRLLGVETSWSGARWPR